MRFFNAQSEEAAKLKETVSNYQKEFATQEEGTISDLSDVLQSSIAVLSSGPLFALFA